MPKLKSKGSIKKRFSFTASGRVKCAQAGKRHGMVKRSKKFIRNQRGTELISEHDEKVIKMFLIKKKK